MMELMSEVALEVGAARRIEIALDTMRAARRSEVAIRHTVGAAFVGVGRWIAGEEPTAQVARHAPLTSR